MTEAKKKVAADLNAACFGRKSLPAGTLASDGDKMACVVDRIEQFEAELKAPRRRALIGISAFQHLSAFWSRSFPVPGRVHGRPDRMRKTKAGRRNDALRACMRSGYVAPSRA